jgi:site-specific recombinase XerD
LRGFGDYLVREKIWRKNEARWLKGPKIDGRSRVPRRVSQESLQKLMQAASTSYGHYHRRLWTTLLVVLYATGLRRGELDRLDLADWNSAEGILKIDGQKTGVERAIPVSESVWRCIEAYLPWRHNVLEKTGALNERSLFVNRFGRRICGQRISVALHKLARRAGVPLVTLHQFRHTCASDLIESGVKLPFVQKVLGHATVVTTMRYLAISDPERRRAIELHPVNEILAQSGGQP